MTPHVRPRDELSSDFELMLKTRGKQDRTLWTLQANDHSAAKPVPLHQPLEASPSVKDCSHCTPISPGHVIQKNTMVDDIENH